MCVRTLYLIHRGQLQRNEVQSYHMYKPPPFYSIAVRSLATTVKAKKFKEEGSTGLAGEGELDVTAAAKAGSRQRSYVRN